MSTLESITLHPTSPLINQEEMAALMHVSQSSESDGPPIKIIFADPHPIVLDGLKKTFSNDPDFIVNKCVSDGNSAWREILDTEPDIVVMELSLNEKDCLSLIRDMRDKKVKTRPVVFTHAAMIDLIDVIAIGVNGVVSKSKTKEILANCIRTVHQGYKWLDEEFSIPGLNHEQLPLSQSTFERLLTIRELSIVQLVIRGKSNQEIASTFAIAEGTVKIHLKHIYQKLNCNDRVDLLSRICRTI